MTTNNFDFTKAIEETINNRLTLTENGAIAYESAGKALLDFMFAISALRRESSDGLKRHITDVYFEDPLIANKFFFYARDCRGGVGERRLFREYLMWLAENKPEIAKAVIHLVPEYGRWDDLWCLLDTKLRDDVIKLVKKQLESDMKARMESKPISLLAKWLKSENTSSKESKRYAKILCNGLGLTPRRYRKTLSRLRAYLDVVEVKSSDNRWDEIKYETVPSQAGVKYSDAFMRHDGERRIKYLESLKRGETKINTSVLQPHEIVGKYVNGGGWALGKIKPYDEALEQLWVNLPAKEVGNTLVVMDSSGSMTGGYGTKLRPIDVAAALANFTADHNTGIWKGKFITFSHNPKIVDESHCDSLHDKLVLTYSNSEVANTDIEKTMMLILRTAVNNNCSQADMPRNVLILSDMQFDSMVTITGGRSNAKTLFEHIAEEFKRYGYQMPRIIFWNLSGVVNKTVPMQKNELGVVLMSGFSTQLLNMVMSGETDPYKVLLEAINNPRYDAVEKAIKDLV